MTIVTTCPECRQRHSIEIDESGYKDLKAGELIQKALPGLTATQREMLKTGICGWCWERMFGREEKEGSRFGGEDSW